MGQKIADHVHHVDGGLLVGHSNVNVHAENQEGAGQLLEFLDDVFVAFAGRDDLVNPAGKWVGAGGGNLQTHAFCCSHELAPRTVHFDAQLADVFAYFCAGLDDGLVHLVFNLVNDVRRSGGNKLHDM